MVSRRMRLVAFLVAGPTSHHHGMWLHPQTTNNLLDPARYEHIARVLEDGCFDSLFLADSLALFGAGDPGSIELSKGMQMGLLDPLALIPVMSRVTTHIGLGVTVSTSFVPPFQIARSLGTLDVLSGGRVAWNVVTSTAGIEARNYGLDDVPARDERYDRADEVVEACCALWDSWDEGAFVMDKRTGLCIDPSRVRPVNYRGKWIATDGPLTVPRSPQGRPVIMQAGASPRGRDFAARWAEIIFTMQHDLDSMIEFYTDIKSRMVAYGRDPDECAILVSVDPIVGETTAIAKEKQAYVNGLIDAELSIAHMSSHVGVDLSVHPLDTPITEALASIGEHGSVGALSVILQRGRQQDLTLAEAAREYSTSQLCPQIVGTPEEVADLQREYFEAGGCDGFIVTPTEYPGTFETYVRAVVPILQDRGLVRSDYPGTTLRENLRA